MEFNVTYHRLPAAWVGESPPAHHVLTMGSGEDVETLGSPHRGVSGSSVVTITLGSP